METERDGTPKSIKSSYEPNTRDKDKCGCFPKTSDVSVPTMMYDKVKCTHGSAAVVQPAHLQMFVIPWTPADIKKNADDKPDVVKNIKISVPTDVSKNENKKPKKSSKENEVPKAEIKEPRAEIESRRSERVSELRTVDTFDSKSLGRHTPGVLQNTEHTPGKNNRSDRKQTSRGSYKTEINKTNETSDGKEHTAKSTKAQTEKAYTSEFLKTIPGLIDIGIEGKIPPGKTAGSIKSSASKANREQEETKSYISTLLQNGNSFSYLDPWTKEARTYSINYVKDAKYQVPLPNPRTRGPRTKPVNVTPGTNKVDRSSRTISATAGTNNDVANKAQHDSKSDTREKTNPNTSKTTTKTPK